MPLALQVGLFAGEGVDVTPKKVLRFFSEAKPMKSTFEMNTQTHNYYIPYIQDGCGPYSGLQLQDYYHPLLLSDKHTLGTLAEMF